MDLHIVLVGHLQENKERIRNFRKTGDSRYIYQNELDKACFQHDMAYENLKDLTRGTTSGKILHDKAFTVAKNRKYDGCWREFVSMVCNFVDTKTSDAAIKNGNITNQELAEELHKPIIRKLENWNIIDISSKYAWVSPLKDKKDITITNAFQKILDESNRKPNKIWIEIKTVNFTREQLNHVHNIII